MYIHTLIGKCVSNIPLNCIVASSMQSAIVKACQISCHYHKNWVVPLASNDISKFLVCVTRLLLSTINPLPILLLTVLVIPQKTHFTGALNRKIIDCRLFDWRGGINVNAVTGRSQLMNVQRKITVYGSIR